MSMCRRCHGRVLGFYLPVKRKNDTEEIRAALRDLEESVAELRSHTGLSREDLLEEILPGKHGGPEREHQGK
ncbi:hypothetical protein BH23ACT11_BH23ACT11_28130 [soil metagenome]